MLVSGKRITSGLANVDRNIVRADLLTGASAALWIAPGLLVKMPVSHQLFVLVTVLAGVASLGTLLLGVVYRGQRDFNAEQRAERDQRREDAAATRREIAELRQLVLDLQLYSQAQGADLCNRIDAVAGRVERDRWNAYSEAAADMQGGEEVVDSTDTRNLTEASAAVFNLPSSRRTTNGRF